MNRTWVAETRLEKVGQREDECEAGHDGDDNVYVLNEVRTVEGEEQGAGGHDEEKGEVENASLLGHHNSPAAEVLKRKKALLRS